MKTALIVDVETTGLDPAKDAAIEIGALLYSIEHRSTVAAVSTLIPSEGNAAEATNRIDARLLADVVTKSALDACGPAIQSFLALADCVVAHNADFDRAFLRSRMTGWSQPWLCTMDAFAWPVPSPSASLVSIALAHGVGVSAAHRALTDCTLIAALFDRMHLFGRDLGEMFAHAARPRATYQALVSYDDREKAKAAGFRWDGGERRWWRKMAIEDAAALPFRVCVLPECAA